MRITDKQARNPLEGVRLTAGTAYDAGEPGTPRGGEISRATRVAVTGGPHC
ncbi:hypothetical protein FHS43_002139 [Streptosporangium becharense]|uniref:Uncharacterized protein n=1 Tax=Streptosporangium becharense TaxID=1816182 RepID=A0A7W9MEK6_9ACTN|nr:hypothetical protein [Streptosporangium becharense]MBB2910876.1 hypothetical protein [Streptosporangium becharense]MBB5817571.1 hypothetical protein [Streptosporangium becharense]